MGGKGIFIVTLPNHPRQQVIQAQGEVIERLQHPVAGTHRHRFAGHPLFELILAQQGEGLCIDLQGALLLH
jgi:hypothetical protein